MWIRNSRLGGSVGSIVVVGTVVGGGLVVVGGRVVGIGFACSGVNSQNSKSLNSTESSATNPLALFLRWTTHWIWIKMLMWNSISRFYHLH